MNCFFDCACLGKRLVGLETLMAEVSKTPGASEALLKRFQAGDVVETILEFGSQCPDCAPAENNPFKLVVMTFNDLKEC